MAEDILKFLGLSGTDPEKHPDEEVLTSLGLKPTVTDTKLPKFTPPPGMEDPEARFARGGTELPGKLRRVHEAIDPSVALPAWASRTGEAISKNVLAGAGLVRQGMSDLMESRSATGVGNIGLGAATVALSPVTGLVESTIQDPLNKVVPGFGDRAALMFPVNMGGPTVRTAAHNIHPTTRAADWVVSQAGPENVPAMMERLRSNPRLRPVDVNDQLRMAGQGLIASPESPAASRTLTESMRRSAADARNAVRGTYDEAMGAPPNLYQEVQRLEKAAQEVGRTKIQPPLDTAKPVNLSPVIANMDAVIKPGAQAVVPGQPPYMSRLQTELMEWRREFTDGSSLLTDANKLHAKQSELRRYAEELKLSANGADKRLGRQLMDVRNQIVDAIDKSASGYKKGLEEFRDVSDIQDAFKFGREVLRNTDDLKTDPSYLEAWMKMKGRSKEEIEAARLGARQAVEAKMGTIRQSALDPARSGTDVPQIEFNKKKLEILFGKERTDKMFQHLQDERDIALTNNRGLSNSKTAETQAMERELRPREVARPHSQLPSWATGAGLGVGFTTGSPTLGAMAAGGLLGARGAKSMYDWMARRGEISRNTSIADILSRNDPETLALLSVAAQRVGQRNKLHNLIAPP